MILIVGRTCVGKDTISKALEKNNMSVLKSYTTRPKRYENEDTHIFITQNESDAIAPDEKVASTVINNYEYFATKSQVKTCDIYIIDPNGLYVLINNCPDTNFYVIHVTADKTAAKEKAAMRGDSKTESIVFDKRYESEDKQFTDFESMTENTDIISKNCRIIYRYHNDFTKKTLRKSVKEILAIIAKEGADAK